MLSASSDGPYIPDMPMQPKPMAETWGPAEPNWRVNIGDSLRMDRCIVRRLVICRAIRRPCGDDGTKPPPLQQCKTARLPRTGRNFSPLTLGTVDADVVDEHGLGKPGCGVGRAGPVAADRDIQDQKERMVEDPGTRGGGSGGDGTGAEGGVERFVHVKAHDIRLPFDGVKVKGGREVFSSRQARCRGRIGGRT